MSTAAAPLLTSPHLLKKESHRTHAMHPSPPLSLPIFYIHTHTLPVSADLLTYCALSTVGSDLIYGPKAVEAMQSLLYTVSALLRRDTVADTNTSSSTSIPTDTLPEININCEKAPPSPLPLPCSCPGGLSSTRAQGCFLLAYMRSGSVPLEELFREAGRHGLAPLVLEDFTW